MSILVVAMMSIGASLPTMAQSGEASSEATPGTPSVPDLLDRFNREGVPLEFWVDAEGLLQRSQEARTGVIGELRSVLAPYAECTIEMGFVTAAGTRQESFDIAAFVAGTLIVEFPEFDADRKVAATASEDEDPFDRGHVRMVLLFNEGCVPDFGTPSPVASPFASAEPAVG